jgi:uncharacterized protein (DUF488 family)
MTANKRHVLTIGHSNHSLDAFVSLLQQHSVTAVADVRSAPYSRFTPHFNKEALQRALKDHRIRYVFLGRELGARSEDRSCYENGRVLYARLALTDVFRSGIDRVLHGAGEQRIALMCAEKEPLDCHRTLLIARALEEHGAAVDHILPDGGIESHGEAMLRLLDLLGLPRRDLFHSTEELIKDALARQEERIAYVDKALAAEADRGTR